METPRPVTSCSAEFPRSSQASLSLPSFLYGNPRFRVTPSFFRLCSPFIRPPTRQHRRKAATPWNRRDASPLPPPLDPNNNVSARFRSQIVSWRPPAPIVPNGGCAGTQSFPLPNLSRAVLVVRCAARSPTAFPRFRLTLAGAL
jgi:hypothetical protein